MSTANPSYKPSEGKREEFRKYLEKNGVMDALTKVLVNLYEEAEKPEDALEYIRDKLAVIAGVETYKQLQLKLSTAEERLKELENQLQPTEVTPVKEGSAVEQLNEEPVKEGSTEKAVEEKVDEEENAEGEQ